MQRSRPLYSVGSPFAPGHPADSGARCLALCGWLRYLIRPRRFTAQEPCSPLVPEPPASPETGAPRSCEVGRYITFTDERSLLGFAWVETGVRGSFRMRTQGPGLEAGGRPVLGTDICVSCCATRSAWAGSVQ